MALQYHHPHHPAYKLDGLGDVAVRSVAQVDGSIDAEVAPSARIAADGKGSADPGFPASALGEVAVRSVASVRGSIDAELVPAARVGVDGKGSADPGFPASALGEVAVRANAVVNASIDAEVIPLARVAVDGVGSAAPGVPGSALGEVAVRSSAALTASVDAKLIPSARVAIDGVGKTRSFVEASDDVQGGSDDLADGTVQDVYIFDADGNQIDGRAQSQFSGGSVEDDNDSLVQWRNLEGKQLDVSEVSVFGGTATEDVRNFESGDLSGWNSTDADFSVVSSIAESFSVRGSYSGYCSSTNSPLEFGTFNFTRGQVNLFEWVWAETQSGSFGCGIRIYNDNNDVVIGAATDNPEWYTWDPTFGSSQLYGGDGYERWVRTQLRFDWESGAVAIEFEDLQSGTIKSTFIGFNTSYELDRAIITSFNTDNGGWVSGQNVNYWLDDVRARDHGTLVATGPVGSYTVVDRGYIRWQAGELAFSNEPPIADLVDASKSGCSVDWDATGSTDPEGTALDFRFDWENTGFYDTGWLSSGTQTYDYQSDGTYTCKVQVRDADGKTDTATHTVSVVCT